MDSTIVAPASPSPDEWATSMKLDRAGIAPALG